MNRFDEIFQNLNLSLAGWGVIRNVPTAKCPPQQIH